MDELWNSVLAEIEVEVSKPLFSTFFKNTKLVALDSATATIASSTPMASSYIKDRYASLLKKVLDKKTEHDLELIFTSQERAEVKKEAAGPLFAKELLAKRPQVRPARIRPDYTFENLAVSGSNQLAYTAASTIAAAPGSKYNPLFLYGTVGVGKTHLMHAVANKVFDDGENIKVLYMTTEEFTNEVVEAIMDKTTTQIRKKFRNIDLLLLDDIQFLSGKEKVQEELFHTFNTLIDRGSQIIFSSDRPPSEIKKIEARLASRFEGGLTVDISAPDFELRTAILLIKSAKFGMNLSLDHAKLIAERITDARALEGFLLKLSTITFTSGNASLDERTILNFLGKPREISSVLHPDTIIDTVCDYFHIRSTQLKGSKRDASLVKSRHICMYLLKEEARLTFVEIGNLLGGRDHTTVMHGVEKMKELLEKEERLIEEVRVIKKQIIENAQAL